MNSLLSGLHTILVFIPVLSILVFIHEFGHYIVAKMCGVRVTTFSIGFGKELFGINDRSGTRWKFSVLPLGGYVKMFGDSSAASTPDNDALTTMSEEDKKTAFHYKKLWQKALVVAAGPVANFLLSIAIFTYFILSNGLPTVEPVIGTIVAESPADKAGLQEGDRIIAINNDKVKIFSDIPQLIVTNLDTPVVLHILRGEEKLTVTLTPDQIQDDDGLGNKITRPRIGIRSAKLTTENVGVVRAVSEATKEVYTICSTSLEVIGQMITGKRSAKDLRGTIGVAQITGQAAEKGFEMVVILMANISVGLGLLNLFPVPVLDGGHLLYYTIEAAIRRPLSMKAQEFGFRIGFALIAMLLAFTFINDITRFAS